MNFLIELYLKLVAHRWSIGFIEETQEDIVKGKPFTVHYVKGIPNDKWYADPFILNYNDSTIELLVEEFRYKCPRGRIAKLVISRNDYSLIEEKIVLELDTHLSFPFIQRIDGNIFVSPENSESGCWNRYRYDVNKDRLIFDKQIINLPLTDAVINTLMGKEYIFATKLPNASGNELFIYDIDGNLNSQKCFTSNIARGAGDWFKVGNRIFRPAQDCSEGYGQAIILQEVISNLNGTMDYKNIRRLESNHPRFSRGMHTFNSYKDLIVVDVLGYKNHYLGTFADRMKISIKKVFK